MSSRKVLPALALLLLLVLPGSKYLWFDGLPLSNWPERVALFVLSLAVIPRTSRARLARFLQHRAMHGWGGTFLLVLLVAKLWSYFAFPLGGGFEVCLRSLYEPVESCEKSYEATFLTRDGINALGSISRTEDHIDFGPIDRSRPNTDQDTAGSNWNLPFTNDFPRLSELWLDRLPFRADIGTRIYLERDGYLPVRLVGDLEVSYSKGSRGELGTTVTKFSSYQDETQYFLALPQGDGVLRLKYEFKEGPTGPIPDTSPTPTGPYATLSLFETTASTNATPHELLTPVPRDVPNLPVSIAISALNFALAAIIFGLVLVATFSATLLFAVALMLTSVVSTYLIGRVVDYSSVFGIGLVVVTLLGFYLLSSRLRQHRWVTALSLSFGVALVLVQSTVQRINGLGSLVPLDYMMFRGRDTDWLVYQGYARQIFLEQSLRAGESTYYFTPGMRYVVFLQHLLLGDSDLVIAIVTSASLFAVTLLLLSHVRLQRENILPLVVCSALLATWFRPLVLELTVNGAAESIAWWCLLSAAALVVARGGIGHPLTTVAVALTGMAVFIRPNYLFAAIVLFVWMLLSFPMNWVLRVRFGLLFAVILSLAFFHNLHFGESSTPFTVFVSLDRDLALSDFLRSPYDSDTRAVVIDKIRYAMSWGGGDIRIGTSIVAWLLQGAWLYSLTLVVRHKLDRRALVLLSTPIVYLASMLPFRFTNIPARHFVTVSLLMAIGSIVVQRQHHSTRYLQNQ